MSCLVLRLVQPLYKLPVDRGSFDWMLGVWTLQSEYTYGQILTQLHTGNVTSDRTELVSTFHQIEAILPPALWRAWKIHVHAACHVANI